MFKNTRLGARLVFAFLSLALMAAVVSIFSYGGFHKLLKPLTEDIPAALDEIEATSQLDSMAQKIRLYDQVLSEAVRNYVDTGERQWKYRYKEFEPRLDAAIREAIDRGDDEDKKSFSSLRRAKEISVNYETQAITAVDRGLQARGNDILKDLEYWQSKREYKSALEQYAERRGKKYGDTLEVTATKVDSIVKETRGLVTESLQALLVLSIFAAFLAVFLGFFVSRSILKPITALQAGAEIIGKGNLSHRIAIRSADEIGHLADAFNQMTEKLQESYYGLEEKVREKTSELAKKVEEIEEQNKVLEMSKKATLNILEDLEMAKSEVEEEKAKYEAILASIGDGMIATDPNGKIMMMNKQAEVMLGFSSS